MQPTQEVWRMNITPLFLPDLTALLWRFRARLPESRVRLEVSSGCKLPLVLVLDLSVIEQRSVNPDCMTYNPIKSLAER